MKYEHIFDNYNDYLSAAEDYATKIDLDEMLDEMVEHLYDYTTKTYDNAEEKIELKVREKQEKKNSILPVISW